MGHADDAREPVRAHPGDERLPRCRQPYDGVVGRYSHVAGDGDLKAAAEAVALDAGDDGLVHDLHRAEGVLAFVEPLVGDLATSQVGQVQTGAEAAALAGQEDHPYLGVLPNLPGGGEHVLGPVPALGVQHLRLVQPDLAHGAVFDHPDPSHFPVLFFPHLPQALPPSATVGAVSLRATGLLPLRYRATIDFCNTTNNKRVRQ